MVRCASSGGKRARRVRRLSLVRFLFVGIGLLCLRFVFPPLEEPPFPQAMPSYCPRSQIRRRRPSRHCNSVCASEQSMSVAPDTYADKAIPTLTKTDSFGILEAGH